MLTVLTAVANPGSVLAAAPTSDLKHLPRVYGRLDIRGYASPASTRDYPPGTALGFRFGKGGLSGWDIFFMSANTALFGLAVVNAFIPKWLPNSTGDRWGLNGSGAPAALPGGESRHPSFR